MFYQKLGQTKFVDLIEVNNYSFLRFPIEKLEVKNDVKNDVKNGVKNDVKDDVKTTSRIGIVLYVIFYVKFFNRVHLYFTYSSIYNILK